MNQIDAGCLESEKRLALDQAADMIKRARACATVEMGFLPPWHIEVDDENDSKQIEVRDFLMKKIKETPVSDLPIFVDANP